MSEAGQLQFDVLKLSHHPLLGRLTPYGEGSVFPPLPAVMRKAQNGEGLRLSLVTLKPMRIKQAKQQPEEFRTAMSASPDNNSKCV